MNSGAQRAPGKHEGHKPETSIETVVFFVPSLCSLCSTTSKESSCVQELFNQTNPSFYSGLYEKVIKKGLV